MSAATAGPTHDGGTPTTDQLSSDPQQYTLDGYQTRKAARRAVLYQSYGILTGTTMTSNGNNAVPAPLAGSINGRSEASHHRAASSSAANLVLLAAPTSATLSGVMFRSTMLGESSSATNASSTDGGVVGGVAPLPPVPSAATEPTPTATSSTAEGGNQQHINKMLQSALAQLRGLTGAWEDPKLRVRSNLLGEGNTKDTTKDNAYSSATNSAHHYYDPIANVDGLMRVCPRPHRIDPAVVALIREIAGQCGVGLRGENDDDNDNGNEKSGANSGDHTSTTRSSSPNTAATTATSSFNGTATWGSSTAATTTTTTTATVKDAPLKPLNARSCVVCGSGTKALKMRSNGYKCKECMGKPSKQKYVVVPELFTRREETTRLSATTRISRVVEDARMLPNTPRHDANGGVVGGANDANSGVATKMVARSGSGGGGGSYARSVSFGGGTTPATVTAISGGGRRSSIGRSVEFVEGPNGADDTTTTTPNKANNVPKSSSNTAPSPSAAAAAQQGIVQQLERHDHKKISPSSRKESSSSAAHNKDNYNHNHHDDTESDYDFEEDPVMRLRNSNNTAATLGSGIGGGIGSGGVRRPSTAGAIGDSASLAKAASLQSGEQQQLSGLFPPPPPAQTRRGSSASSSKEVVVGDVIANSNANDGSSALEERPSNVIMAQMSKANPFGTANSDANEQSNSDDTMSNVSGDNKTRRGGEEDAEEEEDPLNLTSRSAVAALEASGVRKSSIISSNSRDNSTAGVATQPNNNNASTSASRMPSTTYRVRKLIMNGFEFERPLLAGDKTSLVAKGASSKHHHRRRGSSAGRNAAAAAAYDPNQLCAFRTHKRVFVVHHTTNPTQKYAVKIISKQGIWGTSALIDRQLDLFKTLNHPSVIHIVAMINDPNDPYCYVFTELLVRDEKSGTGGIIFTPPRTASDTATPIPINRLKKYLCGVVNGLAYLHKSGIAHGAVKPTSLLLDDADNVRVADFGILGGKKMREIIAGARAQMVAYAAALRRHKRGMAAAAAAAAGGGVGVFGSRDSAVSDDGANNTMMRAFTGGSAWRSFEDHGLINSSFGADHQQQDGANNNSSTTPHTNPLNSASSEVPHHHQQHHNVFSSAASHSRSLRHLNRKLVVDTPLMYLPPECYVISGGVGDDGASDGASVHDSRRGSTASTATTAATNTAAAEDSDGDNDALANTTNLLRLPRTISAGLGNTTATTATTDGTSAGGGGGVATATAPSSLEPTAADFALDVWSLGVTLYVMASGRFPFTPELDEAAIMGGGLSASAAGRVAVGGSSSKGRRTSGATATANNSGIGGSISIGAYATAMAEAVTATVTYEGIDDPQLQSLLACMLERDPSKRITMQRIAAHPFLADVHQSKGYPVEPVSGSIRCVKGVAEAERLLYPHMAQQQKQEEEEGHGEEEKFTAPFASAPAEGIAQEGIATDGVFIIPNDMRQQRSLQTLCDFIETKGPRFQVVTANYSATLFAKKD